VQENYYFLLVKYHVVLMPTSESVIKDLPIPLPPIIAAYSSAYTLPEQDQKMYLSIVEYNGRPVSKPSIKLPLSSYRISKINMITQNKT
jgi:hypothetical protein